MDKRIRGFTLVEIMVSVLILGCGLTLAANSFLSALSGLNSASNNIAALSLARETLENLEILNLNSAAQPGQSSETKTYFSKSYSVIQEIGETGNPLLAEELLQACLTVSWREKNIAKNVALSTYLPRQK